MSVAAASEIDFSETACSEDGVTSYSKNRKDILSRTSSSSGEALRNQDGHEMVRFKSRSTPRQIYEIHSSNLESESLQFKKALEYGRNPTSPTDDPSINLLGLRRSSDGVNCFWLVGVTDHACEAFLKGVKPKLGRILSVKELCDILLLATDWGFHDLRRYAIEEISKHQLPPLTKIKLARRTDLPSWLCAPYVELALRLDSLNQKEIKVLGLEVTAAVTRARENVLHRRLGLISGDTPPEWMGSNFWHSKCWKLLVEAWRRTMLEAVYRSLTPTEAVIRAKNNLKAEKLADGKRAFSICKSCDVDDKIVAWVRLEDDETLAESRLNSRRVPGRHASLLSLGSIGRAVADSVVLGHQ